MAYITKATAQLMRDLGSIQSPQNAFLLNLGIEIAAVFKVEQACHLFAGIIFVSCTLIDGEYTGLALFRSPSGLYAQRLGLSRSS